MPHIYYSLDFTVSVFIVYQQQVLLVHHKQLASWLPVGGHIEIGEDPEEAVFREVAEESGLEIEIVGNRPALPLTDVKTLPAPIYMDVHHIKGEHRHLGMVYFAIAKSGEYKLCQAEHHDIRWFSIDELQDPALVIPENVRFYGRDAIQRLSFEALANR